MSEMRMLHLEIVFVTDHPGQNLSKKDAQRMIEEQFAKKWVRGKYHARVVRPPYVRVLQGCPCCTTLACPSLGHQEASDE